jgi:hypothetical protein
MKKKQMTTSQRGSLSFATYEKKKQTNEDKAPGSSSSFTPEKKMNKSEKESKKKKFDVHLFATDALVIF